MSIKVHVILLQKFIPDFPGFNLAVVHTPAAWEQPEVFNIVKTIRKTNEEAGMNSFVVLIGCGIENAKSFSDALHRHTKHVQFVVFDRKDQVGLPTHGPWKS